MPIKKIKITDLVQDNRNLNKGTERGKELIETSVGRFGAGRSVLIDKNNRIIAGNKTQEAAIEKGIKDVIIVETDGTQLVAVKRKDIDLDSKEGREMALADNATVKVDLEWDTEQMESIANDFDIDTKEWGVIPETIINPDDFFDSLNDSGSKANVLKITVEIPVEFSDAYEEIKTNIKESVRPYSGVKIIGRYTLQVGGGKKYKQ